MALSYATSLRTSRMTAVRDALDAGAGAGYLRFYNGTPPANVGAALSGNTLLAQCNLSDPSGTVTNGVLTFSAIADDLSVDASGTPTFFRGFDSNGNAVVQGTVAETSGGDINFDETAWLLGGVVDVTSLVLTEGNA